MSDFDPLLAERFSGYRNDLNPQIRAAGPDAVRNTVRRRRRVTAVAGAALGVALVVAPLAAYAAIHRGTPDPNPGVTVDPIPSTPDPPPNATSSPAPSRSPSSTPTAPNGRISESELLSARLDLPAWPSYVPSTCTTDKVRLRRGPLVESLPALLDLAYGDVDADGAPETIALVACRAGEAQAKQVVGFDRNTAGKIITLGRVVGLQDEIEDITDFLVEADGEVRVQVADLQPCCSTPSYWARRQWRTYGWNGERFTQTGGPRVWGRDPRLTDLAMTNGTFVLGPPDSTGKRPGVLTFTVTNNGPVQAAQLGFAELKLIGTPNGGDWSLCREPESDGSGVYCLVPGLRVGERRTYTFRFLVSSGTNEKVFPRVVHYDTESRHWKDLTPKNNYFEIRVAS